MILLNVLDIKFPLENPVLIFSLILFIILFAPILLNKLRIPHLIGLIIAGAIIGPHGFNIMLRDSSIELYGTVGLLYIMFLAGLEIDIADFKKNSGKSLYFGLLTFTFPIVLGFLVGYYILQFNLMSSILLASMFSSHTLIVYPIISKYGITKNRAVNIGVGGTMITDTMALLVLAVIVGMTTGEVNNEFWIRMGVSLLVFGLIIMLLFPLIGRWFFKHFEDKISQYIFVLAMVFLGAFLAEAAGVEPIIGAFLVGLALNKLIPHTSPLMNRVEFVGNALFIPIFLIGVGMLIDFKVFITDIETIKVAGWMILVAIVSKYIAAWVAQKTLRFSADERRILFGLSSAQAAATLAVVLVGYNIILNQPDIDAGLLQGITVEPDRLLNESVLNGSILMILVSCTLASFVAQRGAQNVSITEANTEETVNPEDSSERILVAMNNMDTAGEMIDLALMVKSHNNKRGLYGLNVIDNNTGDSIAHKNASRILSKATSNASAADIQLHELIRYDINIVNGITNVVKENSITDLILGLHESKGISVNFLGNLTEGILTRCNTTTLIYKPSQPLATIKRHVIIIPERAEREEGFPFWLVKVWNISRNSGAKLIFYASAQTLRYIEDVNKKHPIECEMHEFDDWNDFLIISRDIKTDDNLILILSRRDRPSYHPNMVKIPQYLNKYFQNTSFILIYPMQTGVDSEKDLDFNNPTFSVTEPLETLDDLGKTIAKLFKRK
jgi:Kef-type K+ transport system membrane component KefB/nucleotide-binding universal stress UspA family protein